MTEDQEKLVQIANQYEALKEQMKELKPVLHELLEKVGVDSYFQNPLTNVVYKVKRPSGTYISFDVIGYDRTRTQKEIDEKKKATLSKAEAVREGFEL